MGLVCEAGEPAALQLALPWQPLAGGAAAC